MIMEKNDWANVSIENALDGLSMEEIERLEAYYMAEAECLMAFGGQEKKEPLTFMLSIYVPPSVCLKLYNFHGKRVLQSCTEVLCTMLLWRRGKRVENVYRTL